MCSKKFRVVLCPLTPDPSDATVHVVWLMISEGWLSHAILDVFEKEPLPADSELWTHPHVTVTPHVAGYETNYRKVRSRLVIILFLRQLSRLRLDKSIAQCTDC